MAIVRPFRALRPCSEYAAKVASVPYDVVSTGEAAALAEGNPLSFLRVVRSEIDFDPSVSPYDEQVYQRAEDNLQSLIDDSVLIRDDEESFYVYEITMGQHTQAGIVACSAVDDYDSGVVKLHEKTRPEKEDDRTKHVISLQAQTGPVFLAYKSDEQLKALMLDARKEEPLYDVKAEDGVVHKIWRIAADSPVSDIFSNIPQTYVADGHHRAKSASRARAELRDANPQHTGSEPYNYFLSVLFPHDELEILPYNRTIKATELSDDSILSEVQKAYSVKDATTPKPSRKGNVCMLLKNKWYELTPLEAVDKAKNPVEALDVSYLQNNVLAPVFGVDDPRTSKNIDFIGGIRGTEELERLVDQGDAVCAFSMYSVSIEELFEIADQGMTMAPKSTWFEPKLRSGLLIHSFK
jgi:uncharacterized protein (DUF1015 family)